MKNRILKYIISSLISLLTIFFLTPSYSFSKDIAIVVNKSNSMNNISFNRLVKIFKQEKQYWNGGNKIYLIMQKSGSPEKKIILRAIYRMNDVELKKYWLAKIFREEISSFPKTMDSNEAVKKLVTKIGNSVGFVDNTIVDDSVKVLKVNGKLPGENGYMLSD